MNNPNPLVPQGSLLEQQKSKSKSTLFIAVFAIVVLHLVFFGGILMQGCRPKKTMDTGLREATNTTSLDTNALPPNTSLPLPGSNFVAEIPTNNPAPVQTTNAPITPPPTETAGATKEYTVAKGDSFYKIAKAHGLSVTALVKANPNLDARKLKPGQVVQIPSAPLAAANPETPAGEGGSSIYTVKAGDNLIHIAKTHGTTVKEIQAANALQSTRLSVGQKLKLPPPKTGTSNTPTGTGGSITNSTGGLRAGSGQI